MTDVPRAGRLSLAVQRHGAAYLFLLPAIGLYAVFVLYPFVSSLFLSLTDWDGFSTGYNFVGLGNYVELAQDPIFWKSVTHNLIWMTIAPVGAISSGLILAVLLWRQPPGFTIFRTFFFMPQILGAAVVGIIWKLMYQPRRGVFHELGDALGLDVLQQGFLGDPNLALFWIIVAEIWSSLGFYLVIFLSGLQNVDTELLDAATLDGANGAQRFWHIIIPQLAPVLTMACVLALITSLNVFDIVWAMTTGGPGNATEVIGTYTYTKAFEESNIGYGAALTIVMTWLAIISSAVLMYIRTRRDG